MKRLTAKTIGLFLLIILLSCIGSAAFARENSYEIPPDVQKTIDALNASDNGIPDTVTAEDMQRLLDYGGPEGIKALTRIYEDAPGLTPGRELSELENHIQTSHAPHSYTYDPETGKTFSLTEVNSAIPLSRCRNDYNMILLYPGESGSIRFKAVKIITIG